MAAIDPPTDAQVAIRKEAPAKVQDNVLADIISAQDREILRGGLEKSGIRPGTIEKLRSFDGFAENSGKFLAGSLDLTHRMMIFQVVSLFELAEQIKAKYLENDTLSHGIKIEWQKAYNEIAELISKAYDRTLTGTQVMVNIMRQQKDDDGEGKKKRKPAFKVKMAEPNDAGKD